MFPGRSLRGKLSVPVDSLLGWIRRYWAESKLWPYPVETWDFQEVSNLADYDPGFMKLKKRMMGCGTNKATIVAKWCQETKRIRFSCPFFGLTFWVESRSDQSGPKPTSVLSPDDVCHQPGADAQPPAQQ